MTLEKARVRFRSVGKRFPGVIALKDVTFDVAPGSCHALMGENGAGKSTLGKVLAGLHRPDEGWIELDGTPRRFHSPLEAQRSGIAIVHQELLLCPNLTVAENICLSSLPRRGPFVHRKALLERARRFLHEVGADFDAGQEVEGLRTAQVQLVQIAAALATGARVLVMDEPTSSLSERDARNLHQVVRKLRDGGAAVIYVSHRMEEVLRLCDAVTVLRDGRHVDTRPAAATSEDELVRMMIGRPLTRRAPAAARRGPGVERLRVDGLSSPGKFQDVSFSLRAGEVLGLAGLVGAGRSEVALAVFGLDPHASGRVLVDGKPARIRGPRDAMALGLGLVPEDRKTQGLVLGMSCAENVSLSSLERLGRLGFVRRREERSLVRRWFESLGVRASDPGAPAASLSGGNQQKLALAKWLARSSSILILDEPTRGVDVGAKEEIHRLIEGMASSGRAVLMISSELPEVLALSTRILVLREGRVAGELHRDGADQEKVMGLMGGVKDPAALTA